MAPYPEEVDVFTVPHSRMKDLVNDYAEMIKKTNFTSDMDLTLLLESLLRTFMEFKTHEQIENQFIMNKLKNKLKQLSIKNTAVCNCHKDDQLGQMMNFIKAGYTKKTAQDRINYGLKLEKALEEFTCTFIPHMQEEEEVFQPLLLQYFSYEELRELKQKVIQQHLAREQALIEEQQLLLKGRGEPDGATKQVLLEPCSKVSNEPEDYCKYIADSVSLIQTKNKKGEQQIDCDLENELKDLSEKDKSCYIDRLPAELKLRIFSYLKQPDICQCAQVNSEWNHLALDPTLWPDVVPVQWAQGNWNTFDENAEDNYSDNEDDDNNENYMVIDDDADIDESEMNDQQDCEDIVQQVKREAEVLRGLIKFVLPKCGKGVKKLILKNSRALTNGVLNKIIQYCPNIEYLDVSQTRTSDAGLKRIGKNGCGSKLKNIILSGCVNITDATLVRIAMAQHQGANTSVTNEGSCYDNKKAKVSQEIRSEEIKRQTNAQPPNQQHSGCTIKSVKDVKSINPYDVSAHDLVKRDGDQYDLDCLCELYYNECHVTIEGGCGISSHLPKSSSGSDSVTDKGSVDETTKDKTICSGSSQTETYNKKNLYVKTKDVREQSASEKMTNSRLVHHVDKSTYEKLTEYSLVHHADIDAPFFTAEDKRSVTEMNNDFSNKKNAKEVKNEALASAAALSNEKVNQNDIKFPSSHYNICHSCCHGTNNTSSPEYAIEDCLPVLPVKSGVITLQALHTHTDCYFDYTDFASSSHWRGKKLRHELEHLNMSGCFQVTDIGLCALGKIGVFPNLKKLDLSGCLRLSGDGIHALVNSCPNLQPHQLYYCDNIIDGPFADTASGCQNLECNTRVCCRSGE